MTFDVQEYHQFIELLYKHPEWQAQLRQLVLTEELLRLPEIVQRLAEAQGRAEERLARLEAAIAELAEAQKRTEERLERLEKALAELAEAQRRTEERVERLEKALAELAEAQRRTEQRLEELAEAQRRTEERVERLEKALAELAEAQKQITTQLARLDNRIGVSVEREAADALAYTLRQKGYEILEGPLNVPLNGEIDVLYRAADATGNRFTIVLESKLRLSYSGVEDWAQRMRSVEFRQRLSQAGYPGPYLVYVYGVSIQPGAYDALKRFGIGLITDRGDWIDPPEALP